MTEWGEPVEGKGSAHDWNAEPVLVATFDRTDEIDVPDTSRPNGVRTSRMHRFLRDGAFVDVWGSADLDRKLHGLEPGQLCRIVFLGMEDIGDGKSMKRFEVRLAAAQAGQPEPDGDIPF